MSLHGRSLRKASKPDFSGPSIAALTTHCLPVWSDAFTLIRAFHWVIYVLGAFLVYAGAKLLREQKEQVHPEQNPALRAVRRWLPVTPDYVGARFFARTDRLYATPLLLVLVVIETTDLLFATDSIPAVLAITRDAFIVYTSNVFAILGLRSMYFAVAELIKIFRFLHYGLATVLILVGLKMLASSRFTIPTHITLAVVAAALLISIVASIALPREREG